MSFRCSFKILFILAAIFIFSNVKVIAQNYLYAIQIDSNDYGHQITLKTSSPVNLVKKVENNNLLIIDLKNTELKDSVSTVYNNVSEVKNVIVKEIMKNDIKIIIEGSDLSNAGLVVEPINSNYSEEQKITLQKPISTYNNLNSDINLTKNENVLTSFLQSGIDVEKIKYMIKKLLLEINFEWLTYIGIFILVIIFGNKFLNTKDNSVKIGLSSGLINSKENSYRTNSLLSESLNSFSGHYNLGNNKNMTTNSSNLNSHIGLNAYKNSQKNPYTSCVSKSSSSFPNATLAKKSNTNFNNISSKVNNNLQNNNYKKTNINSKPINKKPVSIDSNKFLDSMTKIYEKNGRLDLAVGIRNNLKKIQKNENQPLINK